MTQYIPPKIAVTKCQIGQIPANVTVEAIHMSGDIYGIVWDLNATTRVTEMASVVDLDIEGDFVEDVMPG